MLAAVVISVILGILMPEAALPAGDVEPNSTGTTVAYLLVIMLTSPLQSAAEEYAFRGYLMQAIGALVGNRWVTLVLTSLLFAIAHGGQNLPLFADRFLFGLVAGWLVLRTGGLEAGIALHVVNNVVVLALAAVAGQLSDTLNISEATWSTLAVDIGQLVVFAALVVWWARRRHVRNLTPGPPPEASGVSPDGFRGSQP
jgi:membrane protease YdiL (CAAX protease family)